MPAVDRPHFVEAGQASFLKADSPVLGVVYQGQAKAYPFVELEKSPASFTDSVDGHMISIRYDREHRSAEAFDSEGKPLPGVRTFWFAWYAFHPKTAIYQAPKPR
ncbi:MAG: DUF3179 domain-containing (seleno)protein [Gammaproteobacteria bacterium]